MTMRLIKALNNNVALAKDSDKKEMIVMGRGVAYNLKPGQPIQDSLVEKRYVLEGKSGRKDFDSLLKRIPVFDTLKKIKLLHPLIYKRCSSLSPSFNI